MQCEGSHFGSLSRVQFFSAAVQTGVLAGTDRGADTWQQACSETSSATGSTAATFQNTRYSLYSVRGCLFVWQFVNLILKLRISQFS